MKKGSSTASAVMVIGGILLILGFLVVAAISHGDSGYGRKWCGPSTPCVTPTTEYRPIPGTGNDVRSFCADGFRVFLTEDDTHSSPGVAVIADERCQSATPEETT